MKNVWISLIACFMLMTTWFAFPSTSEACSCVQPPPPEEELAHSKAVFRGKVLRVERVKVPLNEDFPSEVNVVTFEVNRIWKGPLDSQLLVYTELDSASCGYSFSVGREYVVYAQGEEDLTTSICSRTADVKTADLTALGDGKAPAKTVTIEENNSFSFLKMSIGAGLLLGVILLFLKRRVS
ncbi:hypothetical protein [Bacillus sp. CGMCC 1.16541]|uniref:hypothetical protein n=1 Tax=Bacillus sp. CGMCC 1.16541 TaxID=2185143 RepID=UPI000D72F62A|nr:hypothetical protein [Bacillus sp. CGMCC 1.16541]